MATTKSVDLPHLRSVVLAGHSGAGKTTLAEALLFRTGSNPRLGKVDDGTSSLDTEPEAQKRRMSLSLNMSTLDDEGHLVTIVDTPGYPDFAAEVVAGFAAADAALICVDGSGGVEAGTENAIALGRRNKSAALFVITRCDRENADPVQTLDALRGAFGDKIAPLQLAIGKADKFIGYVDLVHRKAYKWDGKQEVEIEIPAEMADEVALRRDQLLEAAAEADDDVLTKYLEGEEISDAELDACLHRGVRDSVLAPVLVCSATKGIGLRGLLDVIVRYLPAPSEEPPVTAREPKSGDPIELAPDPAAHLAVRVFKTTADPFVGRLSFLRVVSGTLRSQAHVWNADKGEDERIGQLLRIHGKEQEPVAELKAGEVGAIAKLGFTATGDTLSTKEHPVVLDRPVYPNPSLVVAIEPASKTDLDKMGPALQRMLEEEPSARVERSVTGEQLLVAIGETHVAVIIERVKRKFGAAIVTHTPRIPYHETIRGTTKVEGKYKKQTGGHGMFGHVWLEIGPNPEGGVAFDEHVVGGTVPKNFFPGVEKGVRNAAAEGILAGYPLIDFKATLYDGSFHSVDSNDLSFQLAASMALKKGVMECKPVLQEPIMEAKIVVPERFMGDVNRDLNGRRGRVLGMDSAGDGLQVITAQVPQAELFSYATELARLTGGRGTFTSRLEHYEDVPSHIADKVIEAHRKEKEKEAGH